MVNPKQSIKRDAFLCILYNPSTTHSLTHSLILLVSSLPLLVPLLFPLPAEQNSHIQLAILRLSRGLSTTAACSLCLHHSRPRPRPRPRPHNTPISLSYSHPSIDPSPYLPNLPIYFHINACTEYLISEISHRSLSRVNLLIIMLCVVQYSFIMLS